MQYSFYFFNIWRVCFCTAVSWGFLCSFSCGRLATHVDHQNNVVFLRLWNSLWSKRMVLVLFRMVLQMLLVGMQLTGTVLFHMCVFSTPSCLSWRLIWVGVMLFIGLWLLELRFMLFWIRTSSSVIVVMCFYRRAEMRRGPPKCSENFKFGSFPMEKYFSSGKCFEMKIWEMLRRTGKNLVIFSKIIFSIKPYNAMIFLLMV